jgi:hypothetical protein
VLDHRGRSQIGRGLDGDRRPLPGQLGRVGVEAEADLTAALSNQRRQPIRKRRQEISRP